MNAGTALTVPVRYPKLSRFAKRAIHKALDGDPLVMGGRLYIVPSGSTLTAEFGLHGASGVVWMPLEPSNGIDLGNDRRLVPQDLLVIERGQPLAVTNHSDRLWVVIQWPVQFRE